MRLRRAAQATAIGLAVVAVGAGVALGQSGRSSSLESVATKLKDDFTHLQEN
jgi:predicted cation transporter